MHRLIVLAVVSWLASQSVSQESSRLIAATNVRLRAQPLASADVVAAVPLGMVLAELETGGEGGTWVRMRLADGRDGWTPSRLTRRVTPDTRWAAIDALARERLGRQGDSFGARIELVGWIEQLRTDTVDPAQSGTLALYWLRAMSSALDAIPASQARAEPYVSWLAARKSAVVFNEPGRRWMLRREAVLELHARERDTAAADEIAWFVATNGMPGECGRFVPCQVRRANDLEGEYLRHHSAGRHASEAVARLEAQAALWTNPSGASRSYDPVHDCREIVTALAPLRDAVAATRADRRGPALDLMDALRGGCLRPPSPIGAVR